MRYRYRSKGIAFGLLLSLCSLGSAVKAQSGEIRFVIPPEVSQMLERHRAINRENGALSGFRIQIFASPVYSRAKEVKASFQSLNPDLPVSIVLEEPDFKVLVGYYLDRFDANRDFQQMLAQYPGAFLVRQLLPLADL